MKILFAKNSYKVILRTITLGVLLVASLHSANAQIHFRFIDDLPGGLVKSVANAVSGDGFTVVGYSVAEKNLSRFSGNPEDHFHHLVKE